jgi:hypothetical protein
VYRRGQEVQQFAYPDELHGRTAKDVRFGFELIDRLGNGWDFCYRLVVEYQHWDLSFWVGGGELVCYVLEWNSNGFEWDACVV